MQSIQLIKYLRGYIERAVSVDFVCVAQDAEVAMGCKSNYLVHVAVIDEEEWLAR